VIQPTFPGLAPRALCGYCDRELVRVHDRFQCPRCAPILRTLGVGLAFDEVVEEFRRFQIKAARS
jgi:hypothetical protein